MMTLVFREIYAARGFEKIFPSRRLCHVFDQSHIYTPALPPGIGMPSRQQTFPPYALQKRHSFSH